MPTSCVYPRPATAEKSLAYLLYRKLPTDHRTSPPETAIARVVGPDNIRLCHPSKTFRFTNANSRTSTTASSKTKGPEITRGLLDGTGRVATGMF